MRQRFTQSFAKSAGLFAVTVGLCGCFGGPKTVPAPEWDPAAMASVALQSDANGDGSLDGDELDKVPGIKASLRALDTNSDGKAAREEIEARLELYRETRTGARPVQLSFTRKGKPLLNATVKMIPEPFLGGAIEQAEGNTSVDGTAFMGIPGVFDDLVRVGFYKIEVTSNDVKLPAKYNTESVLGFEVSPVSDGFMPTTTFDLK